MQLSVANIIHMYMYIFIHVQCRPFIVPYSHVYTSVHVCVQVICGVLYRIYYVDHLVEQFIERFNSYYTEALSTDFTALSLPAQVDYVRYLFKVRLYDPVEHLRLLRICGQCCF